MSDRIMNVTAAAAWLLAFCVMAFAIIFVMISKVSAEDKTCPTVFDTQHAPCYILHTGTLANDWWPSDRSMHKVDTAVASVGSFVVTTIAINPVDGCASFTAFNDADGNNTDKLTEAGMTPQDCFAPLRFMVGSDSYCIEDNQAHTWQLCSTDDTPVNVMPEETETNTQPASSPASSDWQTNCGHRSPGVYGTTTNQLLCWGDEVGGDLGGQDDPYGYYKWTTFTDCTPEGCRTYTN